MIVDRRRIERLSLDVPRREDVPRAANMVGEALRTATLPGDGRPGRLFIRNLDLPPFRLGGSPQRLAQWLATRVRALAGRSVSLDDPTAADAPAVSARDPVEALMMALVRLGEGRGLVEWFWPQVLADLVESTSPATQARRLWTALADLPEAPAAIAATVGVLLASGVSRVPLDAVDVVLATRLGRAVDAPPPDDPDVAAILEAFVPVAWRPAVVGALSASDGPARAAWVVTAAARAADPLLPTTRLGALARTELARASVPSRSRDDETKMPSHEAPQSQPVPEDERVGRLRQPEPRRTPDEGDSDQTTTERATEGASTEALDAADRPPAEVDTQDATWARDARPRATDHAGLFFLIQPLRRLGFEGFLDANPQLDGAALGVRVLDAIADALEIDVDDPIRAPLVHVARPVEGPIPAPPAWERADPEGRSPEPIWPASPTLDDLVAAWCARVRAWLEQQAERGTEEVVRRPGAVMCTRTHVDVVFDMDAGDLAVRKAGLDIDPGWVAWLGRVVSFHYVFGGVLDA